MRWSTRWHGPRRQLWTWTQDAVAGQAAEPGPGELGPRGRRPRIACLPTSIEPDHVCERLSRRLNLGNSAFAGTGAAGVAADRPKRREPARNPLYEPARRAVAAHRQERRLAGVVRRNRPGGRVAARQGRRHLPRNTERPRSKGSEPARWRRCARRDARATLGRAREALTTFESGVNAILANMRPARRRQAGGARHQQRRRAASHPHDPARRRCSRERQVASDAVDGHLFALLALLTLVLLGKVFLDDARVRAFESEQREQAQPGGDPPAAERDGEPRRRRPHRAGVGDRGRDRRHRGLDQLHDRGAAHAGQGHQFGDRPGDKGDAGRAGDLEPVVRGLAAPEPRDPAGVGVGDADGAIDQRGVAIGRAVGEGRPAVAGGGGKGRRSRCRTRFPA